jgi:hypothetical protein
MYYLFTFSFLLLFLIFLIPDLVDRLSISMLLLWFMSLCLHGGHDLLTTVIIVSYSTIVFIKFLTFAERVLADVTSLKVMCVYISVLRSKIRKL